MWNVGIERVKNEKNVPKTPRKVTSIDMTDYWKAGNRKQVEGLLEIERRYS